MLSVRAGLVRIFAPQLNRSHVAFEDSLSVLVSRRCASSCWFQHSPRWYALIVQGVKHGAPVEFSEPQPALAWHVPVHLWSNPQLQYACHHKMRLVVVCSSHSASGMGVVLAKKGSFRKMESVGNSRFNLLDILPRVICR